MAAGEGSLLATLYETMRHRAAEIGRAAVVGASRLDGWQVRHALHLGPERYDDLDDWSPLNVGDAWAKEGQTAFLRREVTIPAAWRGRRVALEMRTGGEGLLLIDGVPYHGIDDNRGQINLARCAEGGERYSLEIEMKTGGYLSYVSEDRSKPFILAEARLVAVDDRIEAAYFDCKALVDAAEVLPDPLLQQAVLTAMRDSLKGVDFRDSTADGFARSLEAACAGLRGRLDAIDFGKVPGSMLFAGHSHIDVAWLWPLRETMRKVGRTYATVMALMDQYPDYHFVCSQAPLFIYLKRYFPAVYERVRERVAEGRFEPIGGTWVENDTNVVSGESLVRQCLYGQRFFRNELGAEVRVGWLPDVFGYTWSLPQVYKRSGIDSFMTSKVAWNETNRLPYNTFWWEGLDGSRLLTQLVHNRMNMYNAQVQPREIMHQWHDYNSKVACPEVLCPFGHGDGGGGPTREMLEMLPRLAAMPGLPAARTGRVHDFFDRVAATTSDLPVWAGEMYFERHRGTLTTQAANKRWNRKCELLYRDAEMLSVLCAFLGAEYPREAMREGWELILLNQFHDIIPGSSINEVYVDSARDYERIAELGEEARAHGLQHIANLVHTQVDGAPVVVFNTLSWDRTDVVTLPATGALAALASAPGIRVVNAEGEERPAQTGPEGITFVAGGVPSCGYGVYGLDSSSPAECPFTVAGGTVMTPFYRAEIAQDGSLTRLYDLACAREIVPEGRVANDLQIFEDKPVRDEAWDVDLSYRERMWRFEPHGPAEVEEQGPVRLVLRRTLGYRGSSLVQRTIFYGHTPRIDFATTVQWAERKTMLKVAFPVDVHAHRATFEIAFGAIERATHRNTSWDEARFEVAGQRWADLSEAGYGVAVLNDCKYGWDVEGDTLRLTLLRSPEWPDPKADLGAHEFTYSLFPHAGDWRSGVVRAGMELNVPLLATPTTAKAGRLPSPRSLLTVSNENVVVESVKMAEDSDEVIIRVYEAHGSRGPAALRFRRPISAASECDLTEQNDAPVAHDGCDLHFTIKPWEIRTFKVQIHAE